MIDIVKVEARNFLSYGDKWVSIDILDGINLVTGYDKQKKRSNGAGKTSFMEIIVFSLFGQVSKGLKQAQIINWKNKKKCETKTTFIKDGNSYVFHRGLKPNFLKVSKNGKEYPINASIKEFQAKIEEQILNGLDFKAFNSLIYSNPNNSISLLDAKKAEKRSFIEKQFSLTEFSELNKLNNECIKDTNLEIHDLEQNSEKDNKLINEINDEINQIKSDMDKIDLDQYVNTIEKINKNLLKLKDVDNPDDLISDKKVIQDTIDKIEKTKKEKIDEKDDLKLKLIETITKIKGLKKQKEDIGDISEHIENIEKLKKKLVFYDGIEEIVKNKKDSLPELENSYNSLMLNLNDHKSIIKSFQDRIDSLNLKGLDENSAFCPTCHQAVNYDSIKSEIDKKILSLETKISNETKIMQTIKEGVDKSAKHIEDIKNDIIAFDKKIEKKKAIELEIATLEKYTEKQKDIESIDKKIAELTPLLSKKGELEQIVKEIEDLDDIIKTKKTEISVIENDIERVNLKLKEKIDLEHTLKSAKKDLEYKKEELENFKKRVSRKKEKLVKLSDGIKTNTDKINYKQKQLDMFLYTKEILKDENIKQFAIANMIPIIEKQVNYYLNEAGFSFYLKLDSWLDAEIKGPGISDCSFSSMSGGERKSIDLAMKFAIMDISTGRNVNFPNILILDELLDSSVDSTGILQLIDVIKVKQKQKNLKVFIVSHRSEMADLNADHLYNVVKENGFSSVTIN